MSGEKSIRARILDAALGIMEEVGITGLSQGKVAKAAGIRQSHLTYYFPKKTDLVAALLQQHLDHAHAHSEDGRHADLKTAFATMATDPRRIRFFLGLILEAQKEPSLREMLDTHMAHFDAAVAAHFDRAADDEDVEAFLNALRGFGMRRLLQGETTREIDLDRLAARFGLHLPSE